MLLLINQSDKIKKRIWYESFYAICGDVEDISATTISSRLQTMIDDPRHLDMGKAPFDAD